MGGSGRRPPAFEHESEAYSLYQKGLRLLRERHPGAAALVLARALRLEPGRNSIREALARAHYALGRHEEAARLFAEVVRDVPDNDYAHYALSRCLRRLGRTAEARTHLRLARALRPGEPRYRE